MAAEVRKADLAAVEAAAAIPLPSSRAASSADAIPPPLPLLEAEEVEHLVPPTPSAHYPTTENHGGEAQTEQERHIPTTVKRASQSLEGKGDGHGAEKRSSFVSVAESQKVDNVKSLAEEIDEEESFRTGVIVEDSMDEQHPPAEDISDATAGTTASEELLSPEAPPHEVSETTETENPECGLEAIENMPPVDNRFSSQTAVVMASDEPLRDRSGSGASDSSIQVDWKTLDQREEDQSPDTDEQTTLLLARLEQENTALATDPKSGLKGRARKQSRPPSIIQLKRLVQDQGPRSVRFSQVPEAAPMTELDFWAALVRDYPTTAQRLPTIVSNKIRKGIPPPLRGVVWVSIAGARDKVIEDQYDRLCGESSPYENMIGKDIGRSFPGHSMFRDPDGDGQRMLGRVLKCYSLYDEKIGYCQGLGFLVGPLLMHMGDREAFCVLVRLMEDYDLRSCFLPDLSGLHLRIYQFKELLHHHVPKLAAHLDALSVEPSYLSQWFLSFFAVTCPLPLLFRIYDVIFAEGASETTMRVALSIMQRNEKKLLAFKEFEDVMQLLLSRQLWDVYGMNAASADDFVNDFVSFTNLVTKESLHELEASFREAQNGETGAKGSPTPAVQSAASRFLGRLWNSHSAPKSATLVPQAMAGSASSRENSMLLRTPSKQSLSTLSSVEVGSDSIASTVSSASTDISSTNRDSSVDYAPSIQSIKSPTEAYASGIVRATTMTKDRDLHYQIEDLLNALSEMQRQHAQLAAELQRERENRSDDHAAIQSLVTHLQTELSAPERPQTEQSNHRRVLSASSHSTALGTMSIDSFADTKTTCLSGQPLTLTSTSTTHHLLTALSARLTSNSTPSHPNESKTSLRSTILSLQTHLASETTRAAALTAQLSSREADVLTRDNHLASLTSQLSSTASDLATRDHELAGQRDDLMRARARARDLQFENHRLENALKEAKAEAAAAVERAGRRKESGDPSASGSGGGLRELRLGKGLAQAGRANTTGPLTTTSQNWSKRTSSLLAGNYFPSGSTGHHQHSSSTPAVRSLPTTPAPLSIPVSPTIATEAGLPSPVSPKDGRYPTLVRTPTEPTPSTALHVEGAGAERAVDGEGLKTLKRQSTASNMSTGSSGTDGLLLALATAKTGEAVARQELEELQTRFDALRREMTALQTTNLQQRSSSGKNVSSAASISSATTTGMGSPFVMTGIAESSSSSSFSSTTTATTPSSSAASTVSSRDTVVSASASSMSSTGAAAAFGHSVSRSITELGSAWVAAAASARTGAGAGADGRKDDQGNAGAPAASGQGAQTVGGGWMGGAKAAAGGLFGWGRR